MSETPPAQGSARGHSPRRPAPPGGGGTFVGAPTISIGACRPAGFAFFQDAFRPFYFGGAIFAAAGVALWLWAWRGGTVAPSLPSLYWHAHEMVFGFAVAIIVGFLFTAARNWTGLPLPAGVELSGLFLLWVAARVGMFLAYGIATAVVDTLLVFIVAGVLVQRFIRAGSLQNLQLVGVLVMLGLANATFHASMLKLVPIPPLAPVEAGLMLVVLIEMIIGGRVVPGFTAHAIPGVRQDRSVWLHWGAFAGAALAFVADAARVPSSIAGTTALVAAGAVAAQALGWNPLASRGRAMLWVLHAAYAWIPVGLLLLGLAAFGVVPRSAAIHAFTTGSMGGLIIGMITRTALGHSGRPVQAGRAEVASFVLVQVAAVLRVAAAIFPAFHGAEMLLAAGGAWVCAFVIYAIAYAPILIRGRAEQQMR